MLETDQCYGEKKKYDFGSHKEKKKLEAGDRLQGRLQN